MDVAAKRRDAHARGREGPRRGRRGAGRQIEEPRGEARRRGGASRTSSTELLNKRPTGQRRSATRPGRRGWRA
eukprot:3659984-Heterocapsa_arctica.AAC.1